MIRSRNELFVITWLTLLSCSVAADPGEEFFEASIRPMLVEHCYDCHGADSAEGKLRLDSREGWRRGGESGPAIVPGDVAASLLLRAVGYEDAKLKMPPEDAGGKLTDQQIRDLTSWIRGGATDPRTGKLVVSEIEKRAAEHWAFQPLSSGEVPATVHAVDFFIDKQRAAVSYEATPAADTRTLIRRATYDLHGLPPTAEQLRTPREDFPRLVQQLLADSHYGERWGRHWLDVARYSDAKDGVLMYGDGRIRPFAYTYRDYVIRAFNSDKPFDDFVREQLAADQLDLPADSSEQAAMGFLTLGRMFDDNRHDVIDDQIDVVSRGFLGLTASCARCHDHKFDPVPTADYYSLYGVFASSEEPYDRPRIETIDQAGEAFETEFASKLAEVYSLRQLRYNETLRTARERTADYLVAAATTEPDISETSVFFLSLIEEQLRPQITYRWRKLLARRVFADDPIFGPWHDMMKDFTLRPERWSENGADPRIVEALVKAKPDDAAGLAAVYGDTIRRVWGQESDINAQIAAVESEIATFDGGPIDLADIVAGGNGYGTGTRGNGIHPGTGAASMGETGFIEIENNDALIPVPDSPFVDGVFVPKSAESVATSTGIKIENPAGGSGATWGYVRHGPNAGLTAHVIDGVDYTVAPHSLLGFHANKGITFDVEALRSIYEFGDARFSTMVGHAGQRGESELDVAIYFDGEQRILYRDFAAQQKGVLVDIPVPAQVRFLTIVVTEGGKGISHDQAVFGDPRITPNKDENPSESRLQKLATWTAKKKELELQLANLPALENDPLADLLLSSESPVWFPESEIYYYLSRQKKDAFRGLAAQLDAIAVKHADAPARAMVLVDTANLCDPVIFQRGDASQRGAPVPRRFLKALSPPGRQPFAQGSGRLDLANAIASPTNPLTARVWVNRVWMHHFGEPLVATPSDFGLRTAEPLHRELLDYLAAEFIREGWRTKPIHELIMSSQTYQRSSRLGESKNTRHQQTVDPENHYFWRANRRRLDLEQIRDTLLSVSGKFDETMYGRPALITDIANRRRTVYSFVERQSVPDFVKSFDFANPDTSTARRGTTTVPQQALYAMNSVFVADAALSLANRLPADLAAPEVKVRWLYQTVLGRLPTAGELDLGKEYLGENSLEQYAQALLMTNEFLFVD